MASFCYGCMDELFGPEYADRNDMVRPSLANNEFAPDLCEHCGYGYFDRNGQRISEPQPEGASWNAETGRWELRKGDHW